MTSKTNEILIQYGAHASAVSFADPAAMVHLESESEVVPGGSYEYVERQWQRARPLSAVQGAKSPGLPDMTFALFGQGGGGSGDGVISSTAAQDSDLDVLLEACFGTVSYATGDTSGSPAGTGTGLIVNGSAIADEVGDGFLFATATEGWNCARMVKSYTGATYTMCRAPSQRDGTADTPAVGTVRYGSRTFKYNQTNHNRALMQFDVEGEDWRRVFDGVIGSLTLNFPDGGIASATLSGAQCHDWQDTAEANPTYAAGTRGSNIVLKDSPFYIGSTLYIAHSVSVSLELEISARPSTGGVNGRVGFVVKGGRPKLTATLLAGALTGPTEVSDATLATLQGNATQNLLFQAGQDPGACALVHMPTADCRATRTSVDGMDAISLEAFGSDASGETGTTNELTLALF